ncbi:histidine kinase [Chitinophaga sancti]|uniref:sensor histidine kinase n=1 Tax=Chitinophaga sancti TaxID=1004 RepID=UPI002A762776|nr:histidine kinase [Chitinophaga sancti]WPQ63599.1 histidine kinase [Chitinophaga sancti]
MEKHWLFRYRLYHLPFWVMYHYAWWVVSYGDPLKAANTILFTPHAVEFAFYVVFQAVAVYFNLYYLIPQFLQKGKYQAYMGYLLLTLVTATLCIVGGYYLIPTPSDLCFFGFVGKALPSTIASMTLAMSIKLAKHWMRTKERQQLLEKEKLETELQFLRNQFNPHFLFNSINSIFFLIHKKPDVASASLAKFSELLRHQLYECNDPHIPLDKEITFLENFIELEKLRQNKSTRIQVHFTDKPVAHISIAPFILMTFIENAFKHVSGQDANWINIHLEIEEDQLLFGVSNSTTNKESSQYSGIGLRNVRRRLDLVYPGQYQLDIQEIPGNFTIQLQLNVGGGNIMEILSLAI